MGVKQRSATMANPQLDTIIRAYLRAADVKKAAEAYYNELREELMAVLDTEGTVKIQERICCHQHL
jgi:hypothetical protein